MRKFYIKNKIALLLIIPGAIAGYFYWKYVGCNSGTCAIKFVWYNMVLFGGAMGYLLGGLVDDFINKRNKKEDDDSKV